MNVLKLNDHFYWIGVQDWDLKVFDIIMETEFGSTYNSYLLKTSEGIVLFESVKEQFFDDYLEKINEIASVDDIKYIVCSHTEPDHSGSIQKLLAMNPKIEILSSMAANRNLKEIVNEEFNGRIVKDNEEINMGDKTLRFIAVPNMHWPDTIYTYVVEDQVLVTCDSFGEHYATDKMLLSQHDDLANFDKAFDYYTEMIMGPFKPFVLKAMDKIKDLDIKLIATGHGLIIDKNIETYIQKYVDFATVKERNKKKVVIPYVSAYGYTKQMAETICEVIQDYNIDCTAYDLVECDNQMVIHEMGDADGILYGSCTIISDALPPVFNVMNAISRGHHGVKKVSAFGSYGWSGEAVPNLLARLKQQRMDVVDDGIRIIFKPSQEQLEEVKNYARNFVQQL